MKTLLLGILALGMTVAGATERPDPIEGVRKAKRLHLYSISPYEVRDVDWHGDASAEERKKQRFHGREVYGVLEPQDEETLERIRSAVLAAFGSLEAGAPILCFEPRHAVCVLGDEAHFDLLLCRECQNAAIVYRDEFGDLREDLLPLGQEGFDVLNALLDQGGIHREKAPWKKKAQPDAQHNAGDRPPTDDSPASDTPSSPAPRG